MALRGGPARAVIPREFCADTFDIVSLNLEFVLQLTFSLYELIPVWFCY
jgi:hypothetical protein